MVGAAIGEESILKLDGDEKLFNCAVTKKFYPVNPSYLGALRPEQISEIRLRFSDQSLRALIVDKGKGGYIGTKPAEALKGEGYSSSQKLEGNYYLFPLKE